MLETVNDHFIASLREIMGVTHDSRVIVVTKLIPITTGRKVGSQGPEENATEVTHFFAAPSGRALGTVALASFPGVYAVPVQETILQY